MNKESIIKILNNENLKTEELSELLWLLNRDQYKERPVTIEEFYSSSDFVAKKWPNIFPLWKQTLKELFPTPFNAPYNEVLISAAAGSGKEQDLHSKLLTPRGYIEMGDVLVGQELLDGYGNITKVTGIFPQGKKPVYEIILEDKSRIKVGLEHINHVFKDGLPHNILTKDLINNYKNFKVAKWNHKQEYYDIVDIRYLKDTYCQCIMVDSPYHTYVSDYEIITHNTVTATISILYDLYKLGCLKDPCSFYGLTPDTMIIMAIFSATASTAAVNWNDITTGIESCDWMMRKLVDKRGLEKKNGSITPVEILKGLYIQTGSKFQHSMGKAIFDGLMDEAAFGGANTKESQKSYAELSSRIKTRFTNWGNKGNIPGHLFLISSPKEAGDFMQERIDAAKASDSRFTKIMQNIATWEADPRKDSDDKFTVFIGNENKEPCMYDPEEDVPIEEMDYLIYPPMRYYEEFKKDLLISIMNYGGITTTSDMALFKSPTALNDVFVLNNPFHKDVIELPFSKTDKQLMDFIDLDYFKNIRHPEYNRFIHLDAAFSTNTLDVYGLAACYCTLNDTTTINNDITTAEEADIFTKKDRQYFIDFVVGITAPKGQEVPLYKVQDFIEYLVKNMNYPIACVSADQFQSKQTKQTLQTKGFETANISVDRSRDPYLFLRHLVYNKQMLLPKNEYAKQELRKLRDDGKKVDHPVNCFSGDTKIKLVDGRDITINDLMLEQQYKQNWVYTFNENTQRIEAKPIKRVFQSGITKNLVKVTLDNGEVITCTPEHRFMLRDGSYEQIQNLTPGTSLMPLYTKVSDKGLRMYYQPMTDSWHYEHKFLCETTKQKMLQPNKYENWSEERKQQHAHKIVSIEFITQLMKVYDLEIVDNHNFALTAGVIVHNSHKDLSDAIAGSVWNCANSNNIINKSKVAGQLLNPHQIYEPVHTGSLELMEFERIKQQYSTVFKGL